MTSPLTYAEAAEITADDGIVDDGRRWWFVGARLWPAVTPYPANSARSALAAYRRDLTDGEVANGRSKRETAEYLRGAQLYVAEGPLTTPEACGLELGWVLAWRLCRWTADVPLAPVSAAVYRSRRPDVEIAAIRAQVFAAFRSAP